MTTYILGAPDPEMAAIEGLLRECGQPFVYAGVRTPAGVARVTPREAYRADALLHPEGGEGVAVASGTATALVECDGPVASALEVVARCDHHRPGDVGFGRPPAEFLGASSLGQVISHLARKWALPDLWESVVLSLGPYDDRSPWTGPPGAIRCVHDRWGVVTSWGCDEDGCAGGVVRLLPKGLVLAAAADHCLAAAYAGQCPGVVPTELAEHRARQRAEWLARGPGQGRDEPRSAVALSAAPRLSVDAALACFDACVDEWHDAVLAAYRRTAKALTIAPRVQLRDHDPAGEVIDLRATGTLPELPEVLAQMGQAALYRMVPPAGSRDPRPKVGIIGAGEGSIPGTAPVEAFLGGWAAAQGLVDTYPEHDGTPEGLRAAAARGYAGGYEPDARI